MNDAELAALSVEQKVGILMKTLPVPVQQFLQSPERKDISLALSQKYHLHADAAGVFERSYIYLLLGVFTPDECVQELRESGIDETTISGLMADINERVFKKLRDEEQRESQMPPERTTPAPVVPPMQVGESAPPPVLPGQNERPAWATPAPAAPQPQAPTPIYSTQPAMPERASRTMATDMELASHGIQGRPATPARSFQTASVPITSAQTAPTPAPQPYIPVAPAPVRLTPVDPVHVGAPLTKEYGSDPYREPIE